MLLHTASDEALCVHPTAAFRGDSGTQVVPAVGMGEPTSSSTVKTLNALAPMLRDDVAYVREILDRIPCQIAILPVGAESVISLTGIHNAHCSSVHVLTLSAPLFSPDGFEAARLRIQLDAHSPSRPAQNVLDAILEVMVRVIAERWFRVFYRRRWIVAARRAHAAGVEHLLLALDRERQVVGADRKAREFAASPACTFDRPVPLAAFFDDDARTLRGTRRDLWLTLKSKDGAEPWAAVVTAPCLSTGERFTDHRASLHSRPRLQIIDCHRREADKRPEPSGLPARKLYQIREHIEGNLASTLNVKSLSEMMGLSVSHFSRSFFSSLGATPHHYVMQRRLLKARHLLEESELPLAEIALLSGFSDQSHFSRRFHELCGMAPLRYRMAHR